MKKFFTIAMLMFSIKTIAQIPTSGLIGYWPFSGNANDSSGSGNHGTVHGATLTTDRFGNLNSAYHFNGVNDYISCGYNNMPSGNSPRTISFWILSDTYPINNSFNAHQGVSYGTPSTNSDNELYFWRNASNVDYLRYSGYNNDFDWVVSYNTNQWYNIVATYDGNDAKVYLDNVLLGSNPFPSWNTVLDSVLFGTYPSHLNYHEGKIDDILIYNRALTSLGIDSIFNGTSPTGLISINYKDQIKIYPNPSKDYITIDYKGYPTLKGCTLIVTNSNGQTIYTDLINKEQSVINLSAWKGNGIYFVYLIDGQCNPTYINKIIKQ